MEAGNTTVHRGTQKRYSLLVEAYLSIRARFFLLIPTPKLASAVKHIRAYIPLSMKSCKQVERGILGYMNSLACKRSEGNGLVIEADWPGFEVAAMSRPFWSPISRRRWCSKRVVTVLWRFDIMKILGTRKTWSSGNPVPRSIQQQSSWMQKFYEYAQKVVSKEAVVNLKLNSGRVWVTDYSVNRR